MTFPRASVRKAVPSPAGFWRQFAGSQHGTNKKHLLIAAVLALVTCSLYYIGDGVTSGSSRSLPSFLYGQAYHELVLLLFSGLIVYAAIALRTRWALVLSATGFLLVMPHALLIPAYPDPIYRILSWLAINVLLALVVSGALNAREQQRLYLRDIINAQEQERHRLSREFHDETAQELIDAAHRIDEMIESSSGLPRDLVTGLHSLRRETDEILERTRRAIQGLQPPLLDEAGIIPALLWLCDNLTEENGLEVETDIDLAEENLTNEARITLFRVTQEALTNIKKHSRAKHVTLELKTSGSRAVLTISDDGVGFILPGRGKLRAEGKSGLVGIQERVSLVNGSTDLRSKPGQGTTLRVGIPLNGPPE